jgi:hypothetical protein
MLKQDDRYAIFCANDVESKPSGKGLNGTWGSRTYLTYRFDRQAPGLRSAELPASVWDGEGARQS